MKIGKEIDDRTQRRTGPRVLCERNDTCGLIEHRIADEVPIRIDRDNRNLHHTRANNEKKKV